MTDARVPTAPARLSQTTGELEALFTQAESEYRQGLDEISAWDRLEPRLLTSRGWYQCRAPLKLMLAVAAGILVGWFGWQRLRPTPVAVLNSVPSSAQRLEPRLSAKTLPLSSGRHRLPDGTEVELTEGATGSFSNGTERATVNFAEGRLDIDVAPQPKGRIFAVTARGYEFRVIGTRFTVKAVGKRVDLDVAEGRVEVHSVTDILKKVDAGGHWSNQDDHSGADTPGTDAPSTAVVRPARSSAASRSDDADVATAATATSGGDLRDDPSACRDLLRAGNANESEHCYLSIASGSGLSAEMALYEVARLRRDVLARPQAALQTLNDYEARFRSGTLAPEVRIARIDLLSKLGRVDEALRASRELLASPNGSARAVELHLLRGNLLRDKRGDCAQAVIEYGAIESDPGPRGDQAQFARAGCLERLGRVDDARRSYSRYLERPKPHQAERARRRLEELRP